MMPSRENKEERHYLKIAYIKRLLARTRNPSYIFFVQTTVFANRLRKYIVELKVNIVNTMSKSLFVESLIFVPSEYLMWGS